MIDNQVAIEKTIIPICNCILNLERDDVFNLNNQKRTIEDWEITLKVASIHGLLPVLMQFFEAKQIDDKQLRSLIIKWYAFSQGNQQRYKIRVQIMKEFAEMVGEEGIDVMFFKGAALAQFFPNPGLRVFNDIDFYLYGDFSKGIKVMSYNDIHNQASYHHHTKATYKGVLLENHYDFLERVNHKSDMMVDDELKCLASAEGKLYKADFLGNNIKNAYVMTPTMNALFMMHHMMGHFASETIPLRMLYDWALFLKHDGDKVDWKRVIAIYEKSGTSMFAGIIQAILRLYFNVVIPNCPIEEIDKHYTSKVWNSILNPPVTNPYKQFSFFFFVYEAKVFIANRWKYKLAYPDDSYILLLLKGVWPVLKRKLGLLKIKEE